MQASDPPSDVPVNKTHERCKLTGAVDREKSVPVIRHENECVNLHPEQLLRSAQNAEDNRVHFG